MSQFLAETLLGNWPLVSSDRLFKSPSGLIFECCGIARAVPLEIHETEVPLDFHIYAILDFDLLIGYPLEKLFHEKPIHGSREEKFGKIASAFPKAEHLPNQNPFEEAKFISPFVSPELLSHPCETKCLSPSLEPKPCPSGHQKVVLDSGRDSTFALHGTSFENKNSYAMDMPEAPPLETNMESSYEHGKSTFVIPQVSCSLFGSLEFVLLLTTCPYEDPNHLLILVHKLFKRMVVDAYVYHKHCKSRSVA